MGDHSKIKKILALRVQFTGETYQEAMRHVTNRRTLEPLFDVWNKPAKHDVIVQPGDMSRHAAAERLLRGVVLPDATDPDQQRLETSLLIAVHDCEPEVGDDEYQGHTVFTSVSPSRDMLAITVHDHAVGSFVRSLLPPHRPSDGATGIPGLRLEPTPRHLVLRQLDQHNHLTHAKVVLKWVDDRRWRKIWRTAREDSAWLDLVDPVLARNQSLSPGERAMLDSYRYRCGPIALGSAMLRRYGLIKDAFAIDTWTTGGRILNVEIEHGPSIHSLVTALHHPLVGILRGSVVVDHTPGPIKPDMTFARVIDLDPAPEALPAARHRRDRPPGLALRTHSDDGSYPAQPFGRTGRARVRGGARS